MASHVRPKHSRGIVGALLLAFMGLITLGRTSTIAYYNHRFSREAISTTGMVTKLAATSGRGGGYYVTYIFTDTLGQNYFNRARVYYPEWKSLSIKATVPVLFLSDEPGTSRLNLPADQYYYQQEGGLMAFLFGGFMVLVGSGLAIVAWRAKKSAFTTPFRPAVRQARVKANTFHRTY